jgi:3alpha(or 20beta)-hydroxysteroid dehydrogenase
LVSVRPQRPACRGHIRKGKQWAVWTGKSRSSRAARAAWASRTHANSWPRARRWSSATCEEDWATAVSAALDAFGTLNVLVNNAGILLNKKIAEMSLAEFRNVIEVNLVGEWLGIKNVIEPMTAAGGGSIVNISSVEGFHGAAGMSAYSASKFGVRGITRSAAQELGKAGIRVNSVHPGGIMTTMTATAFETFTDIADGEGFMRALPISRFAKSSEVSPLVVYLASDESSYCTGSEFVVDGGMLSGPGY